METKTCSKKENCSHKNGPELNLTEFGKNNAKPDKLKITCRACDSVTNARFRAKNPNYHRNWYKEHMEYYKELYQTKIKKLN